MLSDFDQGYYDRLGFANCMPDRIVSFDPKTLTVRDRPDRIPRRIDIDKDWKALHAARRACGARRHGSATIHHANYTLAELLFPDNGWGAAFWEGDRITHAMWGEMKQDRSVYDIFWLIYSNAQQLRELLWVLKSFGEQVYTVKMTEPPEILLQDLLAEPFRTLEAREAGKKSLSFESHAFSQFRLLDMGCIQRCPLPGRGTVAFNLELDDPIERYIDDKAGWRGVGGHWRVELGDQPSCTAGTDRTLPTLRCSVGSFTRMWFGAATARQLACTGLIDAPEELIDRLSWLLLLPRPIAAWRF